MAKVNITGTVYLLIINAHFKYPDCNDQMSCFSLLKVMMWSRSKTVIPAAKNPSEYIGVTFQSLLVGPTTKVMGLLYADKLFQRDSGHGKHERVNKGKYNLRTSKINTIRLGHSLCHNYL